jgi:hypothetical protein
MAMAELKTKASGMSVAQFVAGIKDEQRRREVRTVIALMTDATNAEPRMWGSSIVGFGRFQYKYASGREGEWFVAGLSPRKANLTLYILPGLHDHLDLLPKLGKFTTGKSCLYIRSLDDIHLPTLKTMVGRARRRLANGLDASAEARHTRQAKRSLRRQP